MNYDRLHTRLYYTCQNLRPIHRPIRLIILYRAQRASLQLSQSQNIDDFLTPHHVQGRPQCFNLHC